MRQPEIMQICVRRDIWIRLRTINQKQRQYCRKATWKRTTEQSSHALNWKADLYLLMTQYVLAVAFHKNGH